MKTRTREIAKAGIFGSTDNPQIVNEKDLLEIVETFSEIQKAPISLNGHWLDASSPRLGNVTAVSYDSTTKTLSAVIEEDDVLYDCVEAGYYPDVSIGAKQRAVDGKMYLHHLAYLGEEPPAVKDLQKDIKETLGIAASDTKDVTDFPSVKAKQLYLSDKKNYKESPMTKEEIEAMLSENERLKAESKAKDLKLTDAVKTAKEAVQVKLTAAMNGKVPKETQSLVLSLCDSFDEGKTIELSDSEGKKTNETVSSVLCRVFNALPLPVQPGILNLSDSGETSKTVGNETTRKMLGNL